MCVCVCGVCEQVCVGVFVCKETSRNRGRIPRQNRTTRPYLKQYYGNVGDTFGDQAVSPQEIEDFVTSQSIEYQGAKDGGIMGYKDGVISFKEFLDMRQKEDKERTRNQLLDDYKDFKRRRKVAQQKTMAQDGGIIMADVDEMNHLDLWKGKEEYGRIYDGRCKTIRIRKGCRNISRYCNYII